MLRLRLLHPHFLQPLNHAISFPAYRGYAVFVAFSFHVRIKTQWRAKMFGKRAECQRMGASFNLAHESRMEAQFLIREIAAKSPQALFSVKGAVRYAHSKLAVFGWTFNRCKDVWRADIRISVSSDEMKALRRALKLAAEEQEAKDDLARIDARLSRLESLLQGMDQEFHIETLAALRQSRNRLRSVGDNEKRED